MLTRDKPWTQVKDAPEADPFAMVVQDHIGWVYACARRHLGDASLADDAVQAVFMALWQKRKQFDADAKPIGGWLMRATRYACNDLRKINRRRDHHERKAAAMRSEETRLSDEVAESKTEQLLALDAAMQKLSTAERDILVARFFQSHTAREVSEHWHISEAAAEKRTSRAVEKLRQIMARKKFSMDNLAIASLLTGSAGTAPSGLLGTVLQGITGNAPLSLTAAHAARSIAFHTAHIPLIATAAVVAIAVGVAAIVPVALTARHGSKKISPAVTISAPQAVAANSPAAGKGILTCVAYEMLVQKDFAWAIKTGGKLISGKPGGVQAYDISARVVRALAKTMMIRRGVLLGNRLHWMWTMWQGPEDPLSFFQNYRIAPGNFPALANTYLRIPKSTLRTYPHYARVQIRFSTGSQISASFGPRPANINIAYAYQGSLDIRPGRSAVLLRHLCDYNGRQWYSAVVFDVERYPYHEVSTIGRIDSIARYVDVGPKGLKQIAEIAAAWQRYASGKRAKLTAADAKWTKSLPGGAVVALHAISSGSWPLCLWSPDGVPVGTTPLFVRHNNIHARYYIQVPNWHNQSYSGQPLPGPWTGTVDAIGTSKIARCTIGLDSGKWQIIGAAKPAPVPRVGAPFWVPRNFSFLNHKFGVYFSAAPAAKRVYISLFMAARAPDMSRQALAVGAMTRDGKFVSPWPGNVSALQHVMRFRTKPSTSIREYSYETIPISPKNVKRYVWITRPRHWVTFHGFALQPSPLPSSVYALEQRQSLLMKKAVGTAKPVITIAANQITPMGLMAMFGHAMHSGNPVNMERLVYAPTPAERHLLVTESKRAAAQNAYGLWAAAREQFGIAQMREAGLGNFIGKPFTPDFPEHWKINGAYATPIMPLPAGTSWPAKGQPLHALIRKNGQWYLDLHVTKAQLINLKKMMARGNANVSPRRQAYHTVMQQLQAGKIKNAYALRDALNAALKRFSKPPK